jgi:hypothetical protein
MGRDKFVQPAEWLRFFDEFFHFPKYSHPVTTPSILSGRNSATWSHWIWSCTVSGNSWISYILGITDSQSFSLLFDKAINHILLINSEQIRYPVLSAIQQSANHWHCQIIEKCPEYFWTSASPFCKMSFWAIRMTIEAGSLYHLERGSLSQSKFEISSI